MSNNIKNQNLIDTSKSPSLEKVVSSLPENVLENDIKKEDRKIKKFRPLPSLNVMRNRVIKYLFSEREKLLSKISKLKKNPYELNKTIEKIRTDNRIIFDFKKKSIQETKDYYFRLFGYKHGIKPESINKDK